jgi:Tfp pilus assembly protein PilV
MNQRRRPAPDAGFTLVEAMAAIVILSFGLIAIANLFVVATASNRTGNLTTASTAMNDEVMEKLKAIPFSTLYAAAGGGTRGSLTADLPALNGTASQTDVEHTCRDNVTALTFNCRETVPGVGEVVVRWTLTDPGAGGNDQLFITVSSEVNGFLGRQSRTQFSTFRTCTTTGCPCCP